ncbi:RNase3 domain protein [Aspergillus sclerotioniger CBS 115572]|uniref:RNase3 domain protein n=1 Tax=Aspergillus sclerotioniger CBS 115572 TaxID=1450535 RepID=A0A317WMN6_9EURO|nr:RNase3 domain protein [Aspergillus sclerotioniger CBS 115572]PWY86317.1 RNase3 domain protein [Aspergillus sclerotioniger CBS 115572]
MGSKRKSVFSLPPGDGQKKTKYDNFHVTKLSPSAENQQGNNNDFALLRTLLQDIIKNNVSLKSRAVATNADVLTAATELDAALHRAEGSISPTASRLKDATPPLQASNGRVDPFLPQIPPILDSILESAVFTHPGVSNNNAATYDRLEVLGDAYIELISTKLIWNKFQDIPSGRISQIRELLVKNETLSDYATRYGLDRKASVPPDYLKQPRRWVKTKADIFEAYVAAVVLSDPTNGYHVAEEWLTQLWLPKIEQLGQPKSSLHAKESLAKKIMGKGIKLNYVDERSPAQRGRGVQTYFIGVYLTGWGWNHKHLGSGQGSNKAIAGDEAAQNALLNESLIDEIIEAKKSHISKA